MSSDNLESFIPYLSISHFTAQLGFVLTTFFCLLLVFLTMFGVKRNFGSYKYLLILTPIMGILFAFVELVLYPNVYSHNAGYIFYCTVRPFDMGREAVIWVMSTFTGIYASTVAMISVQFIYRYWAIFNEKNLGFFNGWWFLIWIGYSTFFGVAWGYGHYYFLEIDEYSTNYLKDEVMKRYDLNISELSAQALVAYDAEGNIRWRNLLGAVNMTCIMLIQYFIISYCTYYMYWEMEEKLQVLSESMRNLHKQFFKTLILQIVTPTITLFSPVTLILYLPLFDLKVDIPTGIFFCAFAFYPAMDAIIILYIVQDYKKAMINILKKHVDSLQTKLNTTKIGTTRTSTMQSVASGPAITN